MHEEFNTLFNAHKLEVSASRILPFQDVRLGKILIQTNLRTGEPELYYLRLPREIDQGWVFLMEATVATGAAAMMAIRVLLDHDVKEGNFKNN